MTPPERIDNLQKAAELALRAADGLLLAWRQLDAEDHELIGKFIDPAVLRKLVYRRLYPVNAFAAIARADKGAAIDILIEWYLGDTVDPDSKFGGYSFELESMLDDLREKWGELGLRELIAHPNFNKDRLKDRRVIEAFAATLDMDDGQFVEWLATGF